MPRYQTGNAALPELTQVQGPFNYRNTVSLSRTIDGNGLLLPCRTFHRSTDPGTSEPRLDTLTEVIGQSPAVA